MNCEGNLSISSHLLTAYHISYLRCNWQIVKMIQSMRMTVKTSRRPQASVKSRKSSLRSIVDCHAAGVVSKERNYTHVKNKILVTSERTVSCRLTVQTKGENDNSCQVCLGICQPCSFVSNKMKIFNEKYHIRLFAHLLIQQTVINVSACTFISITSFFFWCICRIADNEGSY